MLRLRAISPRAIESYEKYRHYIIPLNKLSLLDGIIDFLDIKLNYNK